MQTKQEGVITIFDKEGELSAIIYKDMKSRKNIFYTCTEMGFEELEKMVGADVIKAKPNEI